MARVEIVDVFDPRLVAYRHLKDSNQTRSREQFVVEGEKLLERLLSSQFSVASVLVTELLASRVEPRIPNDVPLYVAHQRLIESLVGFNFHRGILAAAYRRPWPTLQEIVQCAGDRLTFVVLPELDNPENLGAIVRIADVFGVEAILAGPRSPDALSRRVLRVSMGSSLRVPVLVSDRLEADVERLRADWAVQFAASVIGSDAEPLASAVRPPRFALVLGSEAHGIGPGWMARCDRRITIPMRPGAESLNVAVAAGIMLHHFHEQMKSV
jgi:tRNA G18 (ribose-2'-O)-methylase SpoU